MGADPAPASAAPNGNGVVEQSPGATMSNKRVKLRGRAFYESIGSPKMVLAPMVEQSEFAWRMLTRSFLPSPSSNLASTPEKPLSSLLAYTPMFHSRMFSDTPKYRDSHFQPLHTALPTPLDPYHISQLDPSQLHLDGNPQFDRPLFVQFCSNSPDDLLAAARYVSPFCDAVDLNLGCPQGIAKRGGYGAFLQENWSVIASMISKLDKELDVPVTAKMRILETREKTLEYARMILEAGASIITVHGRRREQKGHNTGLADWSVIRYLRENLPEETVIFANGNVLQAEDIKRCLDETGADAVMSAEGNLYDPTIFAVPPPVGQEGREYWRGRDGKGGYRVDAVMRRYLDIVWKYALGLPPPDRKPLYLPSDPPDTAAQTFPQTSDQHSNEDDGPPRKKQKQNQDKKQGKADRKQQISNPNLTAMQAHLFHLLRPLVAVKHDVRDALARCRVGEMEKFEHVLQLVEKAVREGLEGYEREHSSTPASNGGNAAGDNGEEKNGDAAKHAAAPVEASNPAEFDADPYSSSLAAVRRCRRPYWVCQAYVRPLPKEAIEKGSMQLSRKEKRRLEVERERERVRKEGEKNGEKSEEKKGSANGGEKVEVINTDGEKKVVDVVDGDVPQQKEEAVAG